MTDAEQIEYYKRFKDLFEKELEVTIALRKENAKSMEQINMLMGVIASKNKEIVESKHQWVPIHHSGMPPLETPVLALFWDCQIRVLERRVEVPTFEEAFSSYTYWDDPNDDGQIIDDNEVTHWMYIPNPWKGV